MVGETRGVDRPQTRLDAELERILAPGYLGDLSTAPLEGLRERRSECQAVETQLSYLRRLVQGRHDIVSAELTRRSDGGDPNDLSGLIERLPEILSDRTRGAGIGRLSQIMEPGDVSGSLLDQLDAIVQDARLDSPTELSADALAAASGQLEALEHEVSGLRKQLFDRIDTVQAEVSRRYQEQGVDLGEDE